MFQSYNLVRTLSILDNVAIPLLLAGVGERVAHRRAAAILERLGLGSRTNALPETLSGGQQQRVAIARAIVHQPRLVVCDEPTSALDNTNGQVVLQYLRDLTRELGTTLIIVTHDTRIFKFADRISEMNDGRIVQVGRPILSQRAFKLELRP